MALGRRPRKPRKNQFGITLDGHHADLLRAEAERLRVAATTLAAMLLGQALDERASQRNDDRPLVDELRGEVRALARAHYNATLKLLRTAGGMSAAEVSDWAKKYLDGATSGAR